MTKMKAFAVAVLYASLSAIANPVLANDLDVAALTEMRTGDMKKLTILPDPKPANTTTFVDIKDTELTFADFKGKVLLVNFWATWCAPCRHEMPALDALQDKLGGDAFQVVTIATGHNPIVAIDRFFKKADIKNLKVYRDPKQQLARDMSVFGLPTTLILNAKGEEIARLRGDADWASKDAVSIIKAILGDTSES